MSLVLFKTVCCYFLKFQAPEELQRLVTLVKEQPLPADAPPLPEKNPSENIAVETDKGEQFIVPQFLFSFDRYTTLLNCLFCARGFIGHWPS